MDENLMAWCSCMSQVKSFNGTASSKQQKNMVEIMCKTLIWIGQKCLKNIYAYMYVYIYIYTHIYMFVCQIHIFI